MVCIRLDTPVQRPTLQLYDALLDRECADIYLDAVREEALEAADLGVEEPLLEDGFVYHMILQHECQHDETMLQSIPYREYSEVFGPYYKVLGGGSWATRRQFFARFRCAK